MIYKDNSCPFVCQADFECFCVKEYKNEDEEHENNNNDSNITSSSSECQPHLQNNKTNSKKK